MGRFIGKIDAALARLETVALVALVAILVIVAIVAVLLKLFGEAVPWLEMLGRWLVLWVGFFGAAVASQQSRHITIDVLTRFAKGVWQRILCALIQGIASVITIVLLIISLSYVVRKFNDKTVAFAIGQLEVPEWVMAIAVPLGLLLMAFHFAVRAALQEEQSQ